MSPSPLPHTSEGEEHSQYRISKRPRQDHSYTIESETSLKRSPILWVDDQYDTQHGADISAAPSAHQPYGQSRNWSRHPDPAKRYASDELHNWVNQLSHQALGWLRLTLAYKSRLDVARENPDDAPTFYRRLRDSDYDHLDPRDPLLRQIGDYDWATLTPLHIESHEHHKAFEVLTIIRSDFAAEFYEQEVDERTASRDSVSFSGERRLAFERLREAQRRADEYDTAGTSSIPHAAFDPLPDTLPIRPSSLSDTTAALPIQSSHNTTSPYPPSHMAMFAAVGLTGAYTLGSTPSQQLPFGSTPFNDREQQPLSKAVPLDQPVSASSIIYKCGDGKYHSVENSAQSTKDDVISITFRRLKINASRFLNGVKLMTTLLLNEVGQWNANAIGNTINPLDLTDREYQGIKFLTISTAINFLNSKRLQSITLGTAKETDSLFDIGLFRCDPKEDIKVTILNTQFFYGHLFGDYLLTFLQRFHTALSRPELEGVLDYYYASYFINVAVRGLYCIIGQSFKQPNSDESLDLSEGKFWPIWDKIAQDSVSKHFSLLAFQQFSWKSVTNAAQFRALGLLPPLEIEKTKKLLQYAEPQKGRSVTTIKQPNHASKSTSSRPPSNKAKRPRTAVTAAAATSAAATGSDDDNPTASTTPLTRPKQLCLYHLRFALKVPDAKGIKPEGCRLGAACSRDHDYKQWKKSAVISAAKTIKYAELKNLVVAACEAQLK
jgi:hypothetical protein